MGSALVHYGITDAITAGGRTLANWRRRAKNGVLRLLQVRQARTIVLAVEHFDVFRRAILSASPPQSVWSFNWGLMVSKPVSGQLPVCRIHVYDRQSSVSASLGVQKETVNPLYWVYALETGDCHETSWSHRCSSYVSTSTSSRFVRRKWSLAG